jgi:hypothetical protein
MDFALRVGPELADPLAAQGRVERRTRYHGGMLRASALLACLGLLVPACGEPVEPSIAYRYEVHGRGSDVRITYLTDEANLVERTVTLPWTSQEFLAGRQTPAAQIEAHGPPGSHLRCVVRYRRINGAYDGNRSGSTVGYEEQSEAGQPQCSTGGVDLVPAI